MENIKKEIQNLDFENNKELRNQMAERIEVLEKVKEIIQVPNSNYLTTALVADYYEVDVEVIKKVIQNNRDELIDDGIITLNGKEIKENFLRETNSLKTYSGGFEIDTIRFANRSNILFTRRALLRVGMLLRDSEIAKEIRTYLLNKEETIPVEEKLTEIDNEEELLLNFGKAFASGDINLLAQAATEYVGFKNRYIKEIETENGELKEDVNILAAKNEILVSETLDWVDRKLITALVSRYCKYAGGYDIGWGSYKNELLYKYGINLNSRIEKYKTRTGKKTKPKTLDMLHDDELLKAIKTAISLCESANVNIDEIFKNKKKTLEDIKAID